jgi:hypothetical protein
MELFTDFSGQLLPLVGIGRAEVCIISLGQY